MGSWTPLYLDANLGRVLPRCACRRRKTTTAGNVTAGGLSCGRTALACVMITFVSVTPDVAYLHLIAERVDIAAINIRRAGGKMMMISILRLMDLPVDLVVEGGNLVREKVRDLIEGAGAPVK